MTKEEGGGSDGVTVLMMPLSCIVSDEATSVQKQRRLRFKIKAHTWPRHTAGQRESLGIVLQFVTARGAERTSRQSG